MLAGYQRPPGAGKPGEWGKNRMWEDGDRLNVAVGKDEQRGDGAGVGRSCPKGGRFSGSGSCKIPTLFLGLIQ